MFILIFIFLEIRVFNCVVFWGIRFIGSDFGEEFWFFVVFILVFKISDVLFFLVVVDFCIYGM